jgi:hypothetical protein
VAGSAVTLALAIALGSLPLVGLALATLLCLLVYVLRGAALGRLGPRTLLRILLWAPPYTVWKVWVLALAASGAGRGQWTRTNRVA